MSRITILTPTAGERPLPFHDARLAPGSRYEFLSGRILSSSPLYVIARVLEAAGEQSAPHINLHAHSTDSVYLLIGDGEGLTGLSIEVTDGRQTWRVDAPATVFVPAGEPHAYRVLGGSGLFLHILLASDLDEGNTSGPPSA